MAEPCYSSMFICGLRAARLDSAGAPLPGVDNLYESTAILQLGTTPQTEAGSRINVKSGCDETCASYEGQDTTTFVALTLELCQLDAELAELLTGGTLIISAGRTVGLQPRSKDAGAYDGASFEVWTKAWDVDEQAVEAGDELYWRFAYPKTTWVIADQSFGNDLLRLKLTGKARSNTQFGTGPLADWPQAISEPGSFFLDTTIPDGTCGYLDLAS